MDAARQALKDKADTALEAFCAVLAGLYPDGQYFRVDTRGIFDTHGRRAEGPYRQGESRFPSRLVFDWPLDRLPKRVTRPHLGKHADSRKRTLGGLLRQIQRAGVEIPYGSIGRHYVQRLAIR
ncbi:hypothetical protein OG413_44660 [Streptomyces sp. NBC_01433]|uniref:hypothetical protein n=1 Tax=Streptomyces sp. NBC_01433 TaxID=2903864 RepID=UPI0022535FBD|nr:hypothetical protein [Streptomyces sp. NBC_01433]MCX4682277.1 hypothetical protein [Streptomyces sp. NBC_01433]